MSYRRSCLQRILKLGDELPGRGLAGRGDSKEAIWAELTELEGAQRLESTCSSTLPWCRTTATLFGGFQNPVVLVRESTATRSARRVAATP